MSLDVSNSVLNNLNEIDIDYEVDIHFNAIETFTKEDYLITPIGNITTGMSADGRYEISNCNLRFRNEDNYFSEYFVVEFPNSKKVDIKILIGGETFIIFSGLIDDNWKLTELEFSCSIKP